MVHDGQHAVMLCDDIFQKCLFYCQETSKFSMIFTCINKKGNGMLIPYSKMYGLKLHLFSTNMEWHNFQNKSSWMWGDF